MEEHMAFLTDFKNVLSVREMLRINLGCKKDEKADHAHISRSELSIELPKRQSQSRRWGNTTNMPVIVINELTFFIVIITLDHLPHRRPQTIRCHALIAQADILVTLTATTTGICPWNTSAKSSKDCSIYRRRHHSSVPGVGTPRTMSRPSSRTLRSTTGCWNSSSVGRMVERG